MGRALTHIEGWISAVGEIPGAAVEDADGVRTCRADIPWPMFNATVAAPDARPEALHAALTAHRDSGRPWFLFVLPETPAGHVQAAARAGASAFDDRAPWMEIPTADLAPPVVPEGVEVEEALDEASWRRWAGILRAVYDMPEFGETSWLEPARRVGWTGLPWRAWTALRDGAPIGCTLLIEAGDVAALFAVGVSEAERRRGVGRLMTLLPLSQTTCPWSGFWSTPSGRPLYESLGFVDDGWVTRWLGGFEGPLPEAARG